MSNGTSWYGRVSTAIRPSDLSGPAAAPGAEFTAERVDPEAKDKPKIVSYRGHTLLD